MQPRIAVGRVQSSPTAPFFRFRPCFLAFRNGSDCGVVRVGAACSTSAPRFRRPIWSPFRLNVRLLPIRAAAASKPGLPRCCWGGLFFCLSGPGGCLAEGLGLRVVAAHRLLAPLPLARNAISPARPTRGSASPRSQAPTPRTAGQSPYQA